jgi:hypothetical protein
MTASLVKNAKGWGEHPISKKRWDRRPSGHSPAKRWAVLHFEIRKSECDEKNFMDLQEAAVIKIGVRTNRLIPDGTL